MSLYPVTKQMIWQMIENERRLGGPFSLQGAIASYLYDLITGSEMSQRNYCKVWGWSHKKVRLNWEQITSTAALMHANEQGHTRGTTGAQKEAKTAQNEGVRAHEGHTRGTHLQSTIDISIPKTSDNQKEQRARARKPSFSPPSESEVLNTFTERLTRSPGLFDAAIEAEKFFAYYEANGWRVGRNPMKSWPAAITNWITNIKDRHGHKNRKARNDSRDADARSNGTGSGSAPGRGDSYDWDSFIERDPPRMAANAGSDGCPAPISPSHPPHLSIVR